MTEHSPEYKRVIASARWKEIRKNRILQTSGRCAHCKRCYHGPKLQLHHKTYERLGAELPDDLELLCSGCHERADQAREQEAEFRRQSRTWDARVDGWASKRYGEDWADSQDWYAVSEEFERWLEQRGEL